MFGLGESFSRTRQLWKGFPNSLNYGVIKLRIRRNFNCSSQLSYKIVRVQCIDANGDLIWFSIQKGFIPFCVVVILIYWDTYFDSLTKDFLHSFSSDCHKTLHEMSSLEIPYWSLLTYQTFFNCVDMNVVYLQIQLNEKYYSGTLDPTNILYCWFKNEMMSK